MAEEITETAPAGGGFGAVFERKFGPLPGWGWAALAGVGAIGWIWWRRHTAKGPAADEAGGSADELAAEQGSAAGDAASDIAGYGASYGVLQSEIQQLQGAVAQLQAPGTTTPATHPATAPTTVIQKPPPAILSQKYIYVTVLTWKPPPNTPWQSTLSGIAAHYHVVGGYPTLARLNGIKAPYTLHPGQRIKVPVAG